MNILMVDVGGTNVKVMASHEGEMRRMPSGQTLTASEMVRGVLGLTADLEFDRVSLGFPGLVEHGKPVLEPGNLGNGWVDFDYSQAFGKPVRCINDVAMQALGNYNSGRLLFLGLGTGIGTTVIVDDIVIRETESGNLSLETARCLDPQGSMCGRAISRTRNLHGTFRRLMKVGGFFVLLVREFAIPDEHPKNTCPYRSRTPSICSF
jgi:predicted NBD/HSP70 family sugar kinase